MAETKYYNTTYAQQQNATMETGSYHLADFPSLYEVQRNNNFEFFVDGIDNLTKAGSNGTETNRTVQNGGETLRLSNVTAFIPHFSQEPLSIRRGNSVMKAAGIPTFEAGNVSFNDYIGADTKAALMAWQALSYNVVSERVGVMSSYKKRATLIEYSPDYKKVREWTLYGCWVSKITEDDYDQESGDKHKISATIEFDKAIPVIE